MVDGTRAAIALLLVTAPLVATAENQSPWTARWDQSDAQPRYVASAATVAAEETPRADERAETHGGCKLFASNAATSASEDCMRCHGRQTHPVDVDYGAASVRRPMSLRPLRDAVRRGAFLPEGQLRCVTCHDARSPWKDRIALPPGAHASPAVNPRDARTWSRPVAAGQPAPGSAVTPTPLCNACHTMSD
jgi:hypothetical protein